MAARLGAARSASGAGAQATAGSAEPRSRFLAGLGAKRRSLASHGLNGAERREGPLGGWRSEHAWDNGPARRRAQTPVSRMFRACWTFCRGGGGPVTGHGRPQDRSLSLPLGAHPSPAPSSRPLRVGRTGWRAERQGRREMTGAAWSGFLLRGGRRKAEGEKGDSDTTGAGARSASPRSPQPQNGRSSATASAATIPGSDTAAPLLLGLSRNWTRPPGASRISVENRSASSSSFFHRRVCSLPAT